MEMELTKRHWENARQDNINIILTNQYTNEIARVAIDLCDKKIAEFPEEEEEKETQDL